MPKVSIIMPSYNKAAFIKSAIQSVKDQTFTEWELIIVDDCSTDLTKNQLVEFTDDSRITIFYESIQRGANYCRNKGLNNSKGAYILYFDADDLLDKKCLENRLDRFSQFANCDFLVFPAQQFLIDATEAHNRLPALISGDPLAEFLAINSSWQTSQLLWKKEFLVRIGGFDESFDRFQDIEINTRALFQNPTFQMEDGASDVFIRVSQNRMTMSHFDLCKKTVVSILQFCIKFQEQTLKRYGKPIYLKSIHYSMSIIEAYYANNAISKLEYEEILELLLKNKTIKKWNWLSKRSINKHLKTSKMKIKLLISMLTLVVASYGQTNYSLTGTVKDSKDSVLFGNALVLSAKDSTILKGALFTDGMFSIEGIKESNVLLKFQVTDFVDSILFIQFSESVTRIDLGVIHLEQINNIDGVTITARVPAFETNSEGNLVVNVKNSILSSSTSVLELLAKSPNVLVDETGVSIFGKGQAIICINGKRINDGQLSSIQVSQIKKIEIISNPPAKYDANGRSVINIIMDENPSEGILGEVIQNTTFAKHPQSYTVLNLNWRKKNWAVYGSYGQDIGKNWETNELLRESNSSLGNSQSRNNYEDNSNTKYVSNYQLGTAYQINPSSSLTFEYLGAINIKSQFSDASTEFIDVASDTTTINTHTSGDLKNSSNAFNANYSKSLDTLGSTLFIGAQHFIFNSDNESFVDENIQSTTSTSYDRMNLSASNITFSTAQVDVEKQFKKAGRKISYGVKYTNARNSGKVDFYSKALTAIDYDYYPNLSNSFKYSENIPAIYLQYYGTLKTKIDYSIGVRSEYTDAYGFSESLNQTVIDTNYLNLFPNATLNYNVNDNWVLNLSYSATINRPTYQALDPFLFYVDSLTTQRGNPKLTPEYTHSIESNISFKSYSLKIGYALSFDAFRYALVPGSNGQNSSSLMQINVQKENSYFASINIPIAYKIFQSFNIIGITMDQIIDDRPEFNITGVIPRVYVYSNNSLNLKKIARFELGIRYLGTRFDGIYYRKPAYNVSFGISRKFFSNKLKCAFLADDIFRTNFVDGYYQLATSKVSYVRKMNTHLFRISITYKFGKLKEVGYNSVNVGNDSDYRIRR